MIDLEAIKGRAAAAMPGPWRWAGYVDGSIELRTVHRGGQRIVTTHRSAPCVIELPGETWALTADACDGCKAEAAKTQDPFVDYHCTKPENLDTIWLHGTAGIRPANEWALRERPYRGDVASVAHPDAAFIAHSRQDVDDLIAEIERYRQLCRRLTVGAGPYAGNPLQVNGAVPDYLGVAEIGGAEFCIWCGAIRRAGDLHTADCPWPEVLKEAGL